jgi:hypothetical protein
MKGRAMSELSLRTAIVIILAVVCFSVAPSRAETSFSYFEYRQMCDASAAEALDANTFVVASDEDNVLRVYVRNQPWPIQNIDLNDFLKADDRETDIEASAIIGSRIYWITSHGSNKKGKSRLARQRFFATDIVMQGDKLTVSPIGYAYVDLLSDLVSAAQLSRYRLGEASTLPPKAPGAINIEGLAATPEGKLLIGFRNPIPGGKALIVPIENPAKIISGAKAVLGQPIELALNGLGIRSLERVGNEYLIVAGPFDNVGGFVLYKWSGAAASPPVMVQGIDFKDLHPEALFAVPGTDMVQILSDDGEREIGGMHCKELPDSQQFFRSITLKP